MRSAVLHGDTSERDTSLAPRRESPDGVQGRPDALSGPVLSGMKCSAALRPRGPAVILSITVSLGCECMVHPASCGYCPHTR